MIHMTLVLKYPHDGLLYPVLLEKDCTRVVYLLQLSALRVRLLHWGNADSVVQDTFPSPESGIEIGSWRGSNYSVNPIG